MEAKETVQEYIGLLEKKPDVAEMLLTDLVRGYTLHDEEQKTVLMEIVKLWSKYPGVAEKIFSTYSEHNVICDDALIELIKLWLNGSTSVGNFLLMYSKQKGIGSKIEMYLINLWQNGSKEAGNLLLESGKGYNLCADAQVKLVELFPNSIAIMLMKSQSSYNEKALLKLLDIWMQYPDEVSSILLRESCLEEIFRKKEILLRILEFIETKPEDVKQIMVAYIQHGDLCYTSFEEIQAKVLEYIETGSESVSSLAREFMVLFANRLWLFNEEQCEKIMELFKKNPEKMYDILLSIVRNRHNNTIDVELIELWQKGSKEAYKLLLADKAFNSNKNSKLFSLWRQGVSGAYEILRAQDVKFFLGGKEQIELVNLFEKGSAEAYTLLSNLSYYPENRLCPEALIILAKSEKPEAEVILKRILK